MTERHSGRWAITAALFLVLALSLRGWTPKVRPASETAPRQASTSPALPSLAAPKPQPSGRWQSATPVPAHSIAPPSREALRRDVEKNPHLPPHQLIAFAASLGPKLDQALHSQKLAYRFFDELADCVTLEGAADTTRAVCLTNAQVIAEHYPELSSKWDRLLRTAGPRVTRLIPP